jgi:hypothetical protein
VKPRRVESKDCRSAPHAAFWHPRSVGPPQFFHFPPQPMELKLNSFEAPGKSHPLCLRQSDAFCPGHRSGGLCFRRQVCGKRQTSGFRTSLRSGLRSSFTRIGRCASVPLKQITSARYTANPDQQPEVLPLPLPSGRAHPSNPCRRVSYYDGFARCDGNLDTDTTSPSELQTPVLRRPVLRKVSRSYGIRSI